MRIFYTLVVYALIFCHNSFAATLDVATPADNSTQIAVDTDISLTFSSFTANSGNVTLKKKLDDSTVKAWNVSTMTPFVDLFTGASTVTLELTSNLTAETEYYILIDSTAIVGYGGISSKTALNFTTVDNTNPTLSSVIPSDNSTGVEISSNIVLTFSEAVDAETGNITILNLSSSIPDVIEIGVTSQMVTGSGSTEITINPATDLKAGDDYALTIPNTAFDDASGNSYAGLSLTFTTKQEKIFNNTVKTLVKNQTTASIQSMTRSLSRVNSRMNFIRPTQNNSNKINSKIAFNFNDPFADKIFDNIAAKLVNSKPDSKKWAIWTEGNVSFGRTPLYNNNLGQDISSEGFTFGIDNRVSKNNTLGFALNFSTQDTQVGSNEANMDASTKSLIIYSSKNLGENNYIDTAIGFGEMEIDLARVVTGGKNKGLRNGNQIFGSFTYLFEPFDGTLQNNLNYFSRLDLGLTMLDSYTETGDSDSIHYKDQNVKSSTLSLGLNFSKFYETLNIAYTPLIQFEFGKNKTINSLSEAYYINDSSTIYANAIANQNTSHLKLTLGIGATILENTNLNFTYDYYRNDNDAFSNSYTFNFRNLF